MEHIDLDDERDVEEVSLLDEDLSDIEDYSDHFSMKDERNDSFTGGRAELSDFYFPKEKTRKSRRPARKSA